ncbi:VQ motif-containing protein 11 [Brachypodium distachyon]|uniref:VQ domain-containing protein n=1 Tax=Brachypodium distachyon TaxID=15368 RepID=A0A0Q3EAT0_BRADI|nr:VQ motif-containing protein 11 [Brachypodium distachyon]KQJ84950.1 hypothetical protein BRADI_5g23893v3 [Brachypodium distachyon]|eukprot:XP_003579382.1 VQ motif-containing protein 11 [Brachypodium distachyon]
MPSPSSSCRAPAARAAAAAGGSNGDANTTFVQADPATFRALVQKLTGAAPAAAEPPAAFVRRPKLQERRRARPLELARPHPLYHNHLHRHYQSQFMMHQQYSPVSTMDGGLVLAATPSPSSSASCGAVVISKEEEEREEKAIACKAFYLHSSPRSADSQRPKLLPLFPVVRFP